jgi:hypothetical protein
MHGYFHISVADIAKAAHEAAAAVTAALAALDQYWIQLPKGVRVSCSNISRRPFAMVSSFLYALPPPLELT